MADIYETIVEKIVQEQEHIIGPLAIDQARKVPGLVFDTDTFKFKFSDDKKTVCQPLRQHLYRSLQKRCKEAKCAS